MKDKILNALLVVAGALAATSCLHDGDDDYTYYDDAAVSAFSLGRMNKYIVNEDGTTTKSTYTGSTYKFSIDHGIGQDKGIIFNPDSLPYGTDAEHVLTTITALNSGVVFWRTLDEEENYQYYVSTDSMDLSTERTIRVLSQSGAYYRDYTIKLNVHKQDGEAFAWKSPMETDDDGNVTGNSDIAALLGMKAVNLNGKIFLFGNNGATTGILSSEQTDGATWTPVIPNVTLDTEAYKNVLVSDGKLLVLNGDALMSSSDATTWQIVNASTGLRQLAAEAEGHLFGISTSDEIMVSTDGGNTWQADLVEDDNTANTPTTAEGYVSMGLKTNANMAQTMLVGKDGSGKTVVWSKLTEQDGNTKYPWSLVESRRETPQLNAISVIEYDDMAMILGLNNGSAGNFLFSKDGGVNWETDSRYALPTTISSEVFTSVVDSDNFIWLFYGQDGTVWRGRLNRLGWE